MTNTVTRKTRKQRQLNIENYIRSLAEFEARNQEQLAEVQDFINRTIRTPVFTC